MRLSISISGNASVQGLLALLALDGKGDRPVGDGVARRRLHQRDEHEVAALFLFRTHLQLLHAQRSRPVLAHDQPAIELELLFLARGLRLQFAHHRLRVGLRLAVNLLADLGDGDALAQRLVLLGKHPTALLQLESLEHRAHDEIPRARAAKLEGPVAQDQDAGRGEDRFPAASQAQLAYLGTPPLELPDGRELAQMPWIKALHVIFMVTWFAGLFYLPRLFVYHAATTDNAGIERFRVMERRLFAIMTIGAAMTALFGFWLLAGNPVLLGAGWMRAKLALVLLLIVYHAWNWRLLREFAAGRNARSPRWYRWFNEVPSLLLIGIVLLVIVRPF